MGKNPKCGADETVPILYGLPGPKAVELLNKREIMMWAAIFLKIRLNGIAINAGIGGGLSSQSLMLGI